MLLESLTLDYVKTGGEMVGSSVLRRLLAKRAEVARGILVDRLAKGKANLKNLSEDDAAAIIYRYMRAAEEGAARMNLKLLADVISGQDAKPGFYANDFLLWADVLSGLRHEEVVVLGLMHREASKQNYQVAQSGEFWLKCLGLLESERNVTPGESDNIAAALLRTGLVSILSGLYDMGHAYMPSPNLKKLAEMADLEAYYMEQPHVA